MANLLRRLIAVLGKLPITMRSALGWLIGALFSFIPTRDRKIAALQAKVCKVPLKIWRMYAGLGQTAMESLNLRPFLNAESKHVRFTQEELANDLLTRGRGIIALSAHVANWDLLAAYFVKCGVDVSTVGREAKSDSLQNMLTDLREGYGVQTIWRSDRSGAKRILSTLKKGGVIAALIDQDTDVTSSHIPFFGTPAKTPSTLIAMGKQVGASIVSAFIIREGFLRYRIELKELDPALNVEETLVEFNKGLEAIIRENPAQWVWFHKRWRTTVNGERMPSRRYLEFLSERANALPHQEAA